MNSYSRKNINFIKYMHANVSFTLKKVKIILTELCIFFVFLAVSKSIACFTFNMLKCCSEGIFMYKKKFPEYVSINIFWFSTIKGIENVSFHTYILSLQNNALLN